jgi:4-hydroxythreonine-4-phosphate dehydrogenase
MRDDNTARLGLPRWRTHISRSGDRRCLRVCYAFSAQVVKHIHMQTAPTSRKPRIAITMGDANGIGPEILAKVLARPEIFEACEPVVYGCSQTLNAAKALVRKSSPREQPRIIDAGFPVSRLDPGMVRKDTGEAAVAWIRAAVLAAMNGDVDAVVTCPINKEGIRLAGCGAIGHTEIVAEMTGTTEYRMSLFTETMRIVHVTGHLPLAEALTKVRKSRIAKTIRVAHDALVRLELPRGRIAVAGLNPHAGEGGLLGEEELKEIAPAIDECAAEGIDCSGPYPPDTVFRRMQFGEFDLVVAMYHDQGHIPLKLVAMDEGVNVTLGVPIVRTSVDHGTAYDIAWKGVAREDSLLAAVKLASRFARTRPTGVSP